MSTRFRTKAVALADRFRVFDPLEGAWWSRPEDRGLRDRIRFLTVEEILACGELPGYGDSPLAMSARVRGSVERTLRGEGVALDWVTLLWIARLVWELVKLYFKLRD